MDGKEVTCAWAPPAKFRSAKGNDYAGGFFFYKTLLVNLFPKFTGNRKNAKKGKSGKNLTVRDFVKKMLPGFFYLMKTQQAKVNAFVWTARK